MPKSTSAQNSFNGGEISPRALGRWDLQKYSNCVKTLENFVLYQLGGAMFRSGTVFVNEVKNSSKRSRLIPFQYSTTQQYIIEMGDLYMRFYANKAQVLSAPATPSEIVTPFATASLYDVQFAQNADTMYLVHPSYPPQKLTRTSATTFSITPVSFIRGPFLDKNVSATTITPSAATGTGVTLTASTDIFLAGHVGSLWRINSSASAGAVVKITAFTNTKVVVGDVQSEPDGTAGNIGGTGAYTNWAEGAFSSVRGYPSCVTFHQQRIIYANTTNNPQTFWASQQSAYDSFLVNNTVLATDAYSFQIATSQVNAIRWLSSGPNAIEIGTVGGTFSNASTTTTVITPTNINVNNDTSYGVANVMPKRISSFLYYVQRNLFQLRELTYDYLTNREKSNDMCLLADHILRDDEAGGVDEMDHQQSPNDRIWVIRKDGQICLLTRNPEQEVVGWARFIAGRTAFGAGLFESVAILQTDGGDDEVWVIVNRNVNGSFVRYIEYFSKEEFANYYEPVRLDCSLSYDSPIVISAITKANPVQVTASSHGLSNGDQIKIDNVVGMEELNTNIYLVSNSTTHTFTLKDENNNPIDGTSFGTYRSAGQVRKMITTLSGLDHLEGETVTVVVDGGMPSGQQTFMVSGGSITLAHKAAVVHVGLPYTGTIQFLKGSDGSATVSQTKNTRFYLGTVRVFQSLGMKIGQTIDTLQRVYFNKVNAKAGHAPDLVSGDIEQNFESWWSKSVEPIIVQDQPLPLFILAVVWKKEIEEK